MMQASLFDTPPRLVDACPVCRCCDRVDGECLGRCDQNGHRIQRQGRSEFAPADGGWVDLDSALTMPHPNDGADISVNPICNSDVMVTIEEKEMRAVDSFAGV